VVISNITHQTQKCLQLTTAPSTTNYPHTNAAKITRSFRESMLIHEMLIVNDFSNL